MQLALPAGRGSSDWRTTCFARTIPVARLYEDFCGSFLGGVLLEHSEHLAS